MSKEVFDPSGEPCGHSWCDGTLEVKDRKHPKANVRCTKCGFVMYLSQWPKLDRKALEAKRKRNTMLRDLQ